MNFHAGRKSSWYRISLALLILLAAALPAVPGKPAAASPAELPKAGGVRLGETPVLILQAEYIEGGAKMSAPASRSLLSAKRKLTAAIQVTYVGNWDPAAQAAFEYATTIWEGLIATPVPIQVVAEWTTFDSPFILGSAAAHDYRRDFSSAPLPGTWYPVALANHLAGGDLNDQDGQDTDGDGLDADPEIEASFNSNFRINNHPGWYYGTDLSVGPEYYDFVTVVLHELGHGLGFSGSMMVSGGSGSWGYGSGYPFAFDHFTANGQSERLLDTTRFPNPSPALAEQLTGQAVYFDGSAALKANDGAPVRLYAPQTWSQGSSYSHLDEDTYGLDSGNALMTPKLENGKAFHEPGEVGLAVLADLGWALPPAVPPTPPPTQPPPPVTLTSSAFLPMLFNVSMPASTSLIPDPN